jgi:hypothetical protein
MVLDMEWWILDVQSINILLQCASMANNVLNNMTYHSSLTPYSTGHNQHGNRTTLFSQSLRVLISS